MGLRVLELFAGISTGVLALHKLGNTFERVISYELDPIPKRVAKDNFKFIEHHSDVRDCDGTQYKDFHLLLGGSSCQDLSNANKNQAGLAGKKSSIFWEYVRVWEEMGKPPFLFENVGGMPNKDRDIISEVFGCEPIVINSKSYSPALRNRYYWTNIQQSESTPVDVCLQDVLTHGYTDRTKARALLASDSRPLTSPVKMIHRYWGKGFTTVVFKSEEHWRQCKEHYDLVLKGLTARDIDSVIASGEDLSIYDGLRYLNQEELEACMTVPIGYTKCLTRNQAAKVLGNGWTTKVIEQLLQNVKEK
jgi:hypothetical protein